MAKTIDIANEIFLDLGQPTDLSLPQISFWLIHNIGTLNVLLHEEILYKDGEFDPVLTPEQSDILKTLYFIKYYGSLAKNSLGAASYDNWVSLGEGDSKITKLNKNEIAKTYRGVVKDYQTQLDNLVFLYKKNQVMPSSVDFPDLSELYTCGSVC